MTETQTISQIIGQLEFDAQHMIAEDDKADALSTLDAARRSMADCAASLRHIGLWRDIETAPRDGSHILVALGKFGGHWTFNQLPPIVCHWWPGHAEEPAGFYPSFNSGDTPAFWPSRSNSIVRWMPLSAVNDDEPGP